MTKNLCRHESQKNHSDYSIRPRFKFFKNLGMSKFKKILFYQVQIQQRKRKHLVDRFFSIFKTEVPIRLINQQRIKSIDKRLLHVFEKDETNSIIGEGNLLEQLKTYEQKISLPYRPCIGI
jgi:hypothetical protein